MAFSPFSRDRYFGYLQLAGSKRSRASLHDDQIQTFGQALDAAEQRTAKRHKAALADAARQHELVRLEAERTRELYLLEQETRRLQREEEEKATLARAQAQTAELHARSLQAENQRAREQELQERQMKALDEQRKELQRAKEDAARAEEERAERARRAAEEAQSAPTAPSAKGTDIPAKTLSSSQAAQPANPNAAVQQHSQGDPSRIAIHDEYLALHQRLKRFRKHMATLAKSDPTLCQQMGDQRRELTKKVGQLTSGTTSDVLDANKVRLASVKNILKAALANRQHLCDIRQFFIPSRPVVPCTDDQAQIPALFIYLMHQFSKSVIRQFSSEAGISPDKAESVGLLIASVYGQAALQWQGTTYLIDVLLAKYHYLCPPLFSITSFQRSPDDSQQDFLEKITGLGAGFAAMSLRDFGRSQAPNPLPVSGYWRSLASLINTPRAQVMDAHYVLLKALLMPTFGRKLVRFYGDVGVALVRTAVGRFAKAGGESGPAKALEALGGVYERDVRLLVA